MPPAGVRTEAPRPAASTRPPTVVPVRRPGDTMRPTGTPFVRLASPGTPLAQRPKVTPIAEPPLLAAGPGQPALTLVGPGQPLAPDVRKQLESGFGADLSAVRVHEGEAAARLALGHGARAFAYGHHVVLGERARARDVGLMAHEVAHVLQQRGLSPGVQRCTGSACACASCSSRSASEQEAASAAATVSAGGAFTVTGQSPSGQAQYADEEEGWIEGKIWGLLEEYAPNLTPIIRRGPAGVVDWVKERVTGAVQRFFETVTAPVRTIAATGKWLHGFFAPLITSMQEAAARIAQNDCKPITDAAQKIEEVATKFITPIVEKVQEVAGKVGDFLKGVWEKFGVPVWDFIKKYATQQWEMLQKLGEWIWDKTAPIRRLAARAWNWVKNKIGIGEGPEGQNGILQWIQGKASIAWDWLQAKIEPYKKQITAVAATVGGIALLVSPAGPVIVAGAAIYGVVQGVKWIRANLGRGDAIVRARTYAQTVLIPQLMGAINKMTAAVTRMATSISGKLGEFAAGLGRVVGAAATTALQFLVDAAQWLAEKAVELASWATEKLQGLAKWIETGLERLRAFLQPVLDFLARVGNLLIDIWGLPLLVAGTLWRKIPACIRDPFVDWIIPLILRQIDIFKELVKDNEAWQKTKADVMNIVRLVFVTKDLRGAIKATFDLILRVFNVPYELLVKVVQKAQVAWDAVTAAPIKFLKNCVRTVARGFRLYWEHLWDNLMGGVEGWLFGELAAKGITRPKSWTDPWDLMQFALDVMGLSMSHIFDLMETGGRFSKPTVDKLRAIYSGLSKAWDWIMSMRGKKPAEVTAEIITAAKEFGKSIFEGIVSWIVEQVSIELATMAAAAAASAGLSQVLDIIRRIYRAIKTAVRWMRQILEMVNSVLDSIMNIVAGVIEPAATILETAMKRATPVVIGFLGDQVGLGGIAEKIREIVDTLRKKVDAAILAIIDKLKALIGSLVQGAKEVAAAVLEWWKKKVKLRASDGKPHELFFSGEGETAEVMVATDTKAVAAFLKEVGGRPEGKKKPGSDHIETVKGLLDTIKKEQKRPKADQADAATKIEKAFGAMVKPLEALLGVGEIATETDPLPVKYPKPPWTDYPTIYVGPLSAKLIPQSVLKAGNEPTIRGMLTAPESQQWTDGKIRAYKPSAMSQTLPNGAVHPGIGKAYQTADNLKIKLTPGSTRGGKLINDWFRPYGYRGKQETSEVSLDGDHLVEMQLGGPNILENLWPLDASTNRSGGSTVKSMSVPLPSGGTISMDDLKKRSEMIPTYLVLKR